MANEDLPKNPHDWFYIAKFTPDGEVREEWDYARYLEWWWEYVPPTSTRNARTVTNDG